MSLGEIASSAHAPAPLRVTIGSRPLVLERGGDGLVVRARDGNVLSTEAAEVLLALGGDEPDWLCVVEGLHAAYDHVDHDDATLLAAASALGKKASTRAHEAKVALEPAVLVALAGSGQAQVAANPRCERTTWDLLAYHRDARVRAKARELGHVLPEALAAHPDSDARARVARNPASSPDVLVRLASDEEDVVAVEVAANPSTPADALRSLARHRAEPVRVRVAANPNTPGGVLVRLAWSLKPSVRGAAAANPSLPTWRARMLITDRRGRVRYQLAGRDDFGSLSLSLVELYARRDGGPQYRQTRWRLSQNPRCTQRLHRRFERVDAAIKAASATTAKKTATPNVRWGWLGMSTVICVLFVTSATVLIAALAAFAKNGAFDGGAWVASAVSAVMAYGALRLMRRTRRRYPPQPGATMVWRPPTPLGLAIIAVLILAVVTTGHPEYAGGLMWVLVMGRAGVSAAQRKSAAR